MTGATVSFQNNLINITLKDLPMTTQSETIHESHDMFRVDVAGLRRKFANRSKNFLLYELYQNAVDEDVSLVTIELNLLPGGESCRLVVEDDSPEGFKDLTHSYTLYADSSKLHNPEKRGIWNLGEKLVLAFCNRAVIASTKGTVIFADGRRFHSADRRERGTRFEAEIIINEDEFEACCRGMRALIPPEGIAVFFNGQRLIAPPFTHEFTTTLPTTIGDDSGEIRRTRRKTVVRLYDSGERVNGWIYEMGIPVVPSGNKWHCDVQQRVPLNMMRDNVTPAYLQELRVAVLNATYELLEEEDVTQDWARSATNDKRCAPEATEKTLDLRFGEKRVSYDVRDPEANKRAMAEGYTVVSGGSMSKQEWKNAKEAGAIKAAGQVTPSRHVETTYSGKKLKPLEWTHGMKLVAEYVKQLAPLLIGREVEVRIVDKPNWPVEASYGSKYAEWRLASLDKVLTFNYGTLGAQFFDNRSWQGLQTINELVIHELAHEYAEDHFTTEFHDSMGLIGARMVALAATQPDLFTVMVAEEEQLTGLWAVHRSKCA